MSSSRKRESVRVLFREYAEEKKRGGKNMTRMEKLVRAWAGIQSDDYFKNNECNSFYTIGGLHGAPFRGAGWGNSQWWGGYCNHGNILFPTWHRAYLWRLENALRSVKGCEDVALAFWDETEKESLDAGLPEIFGAKEFEYLTTGETVRNPLYSYKFQNAIYDNIPGGDPWNYTKKTGYETVRYPLSGLRAEDQKLQAQIDAHNKNYAPRAWEYLNQNVRKWLQNDTINNHHTALYIKFQKCLEAPNYTVFSNTTSASQYNESNFEETGLDPTKPGDPAIVALEDPHNGMHLAIGGFESPDGSTSYNTVPLANGDMGENDTAGLDPIFFFHHCWIDLVFWEWQKRHGQEKELVIEPQYRKYPGTNSVDSQGPTPGVAGNVWLDLDSDLAPFTKDDRPDTEPITSRDVTDITKLGYEYGANSLSPINTAPLAGKKDGLHVLKVSGINRAAHRGSFVVAVTATVNGKEEVLAHEPVLSRHHLQGCANCLTHLNIKAFIPVHPDIVGQRPDFNIYINTHDDKDGKKVEVNQLIGKLDA